MHEPYDDEDDGYDDHYDYDDKNQWYFKFDISQNPAFSKLINDIINNIINPLDDSMMNQIDKAYVFPVNSWNPNTANDKKFQYLGSNYAGEPVWKSKYWISNPINQQYKLHLQSHAGYFINQPNYYKGLFDILN